LGSSAYSLDDRRDHRVRGALIETQDDQLGVIRSGDQADGVEEGWLVIFDGNRVPAVFNNAPIDLVVLAHALASYHSHAHGGAAV
jgi:hypothetical protein